MGETEAGTHELFPSAPTYRKPSPVSVFVLGALSAPKKCNSPLKSCLGAPRAPKSSSASMSAETSLKPCAAERVGRITACPAVGAPHKPPRVMRRSEQALCMSWAERTRPRGRAAHARRRGTHAFGGIRGFIVDSDLWRTRAGSVSARPAVRRLPAAASCSLPERAAAAAHEGTAGGSARSARAAVGIRTLQSSQFQGMMCDRRPAWPCAAATLRRLLARCCWWISRWEERGERLQAF